MKLKLKFALRFILYFIIAFAGVVIIILSVVFYQLGDENEKEERKRRDLTYQEGHFVIPSNGTGNIHIEKKYVSRNENRTWQETYYYVYNYKSSDSLYVRNYIDSVRFYKHIEHQTHSFYWYNAIILPDTITDKSDFRQPDHRNYWTIEYYQDDSGNDIYRYWEMGNGSRSEKSSFIYFQYDTIKHRFISLNH